MLPKRVVLESPNEESTMTARRLKLVSDSSVRGPIWEPECVEASSGLPTTSEVLNQTRPPEQLAPDLEAAILATLVRPLGPDEGHRIGNTNRERELFELFSRLDGVQAHHLGRRLEIDNSSDALVQAFKRLVVERRTRLRAFLADTRRRLAISKR